MNLTFTVNWLRVLAALTSACELNNLSVTNHSRRVAYISLKIAETLKLDPETSYELVQVAYLHDIGISSSREKISLSDLSPDIRVYKPHCLRGAMLLQRSELFTHFSEAVLTHHDAWKSDSQPPLLSRIIHVADRVEMLIDKNNYILGQQPYLFEHLTNQPDEFDPDIVEALREVGSKESFWLDLHFDNYLSYLENYVHSKVETLTLSHLEHIADIYASIVDAKSPFTLNHSNGVANLAVTLAQAAGFSQSDLKLMKIAGQLHDLGKLSIPDQILDYPGKLNYEQILIVKQHTYHTYYLLNSLGCEANKIRNWAAFHHEKLDGSGYPFGHTEKELDLGSRIMAIADITQALMEDRPYRKPLGTQEISKILFSSGKEHKLDLDLVHLMIELLNQSNHD